MSFSHSSDADTIAAISTAPGQGAIGIVRLSGSRALEIAERLFRASTGAPVRSQGSFTVSHGRVISDEADTGVLDEVLLLVMRAPRSYTREDVVEIHTHGGTATLQAVLGRALAEGARAAAPGEFTKRAFLNGRLDLVQAEAVLQLIQAQTELGSRLAASSLLGGLSRKIQSVRDEMTEALSRVEASIDFPDELVEENPLKDVPARLESISVSLKKLAADARFGIAVQGGVRAVIYGKPNVGKSSLLNRLARSDRAIVTPYPGTTRDIVEETIQLNGIPLKLRDTAGVQESEHPIEREGIRKTREALQDTDLVLFILDGSAAMSSSDRRLWDDISKENAILVVNKTDLPLKVDMEELRGWVGNGTPVIPCSCVTEEGVHELEEAMYRFLVSPGFSLAEEAVICSVRQRDLLAKSLASLQDARRLLEKGSGPELAASEIRFSLSYLGQIIGDAVTEDILDQLFSQFCIGK